MSRISIAKAQRQLEAEIVHHAVEIVVVDAVAVPVVVVAGDVADVEVAVVGAVATRRRTWWTWRRWWPPLVLHQTKNYSD